MRELYQLDEYRAFPLDASNIHDRALYWLNQLLDKGITEEEILSHLLGKNFGVSLPNDYFKNI